MTGTIVFLIGASLAAIAIAAWAVARWRTARGSGGGRRW
jgi:xanthine/uracil permease